ncbi:hypothetical protein [Burkholderia gladioli]|uniref:hypothetical protein n=1 Tax=Burkholderia gladioli TaxID=28095 RepID=UPI0016411EF2|nr:hypothetical protein [Burkholderia gladioli]
MIDKYYVVMAVDVDGYEQSDYLCLIWVEEKGVVGYAAEFDACTVNIEDACVAENSNRASWFGWDDKWKWRSATLEEIKKRGLEKYLIGSKRDMRLNTPIDSIPR